MPVFLEARTGPFSGNKVELKPGQVLRIGRSLEAEFAFVHDTFMSGVHFSIECDGETCRLRDLKSTNGTFVNGKKVTDAVVGSEDIIVAGETTFVTRVAGDEAASGGPAIVPTAPVTPVDRLLRLLRGDFQPLFAILDAARDIRVLALLLHYKEECLSLYEGDQGATLAQVAPYLVRLQPDSRLLEALVREGWGKSWGVYLTSTSEFSQVRWHLRHFLQAKLPDGEQVYFRFYDPRVLRVYLPTCTLEEANTFFGPIKNYFAEDEKPENLLAFINRGHGAEKLTMPLAEGAMLDRTHVKKESAAG